jgi:hypothetical protein
MPDKKCPKCDLWNSEKAIICDCGYNFVKKDFDIVGTEKKNNLDILSTIITLVSAILLIFIIYQLIIIEKDTWYLPYHIEEQKQHYRTSISLLLCIIPFLNIAGILMGSIIRKGKKKLLSIIINATILLLTLCLIIYEIYIYNLSML